MTFRLKIGTVFNQAIKKLKVDQAFELGNFL